MADSPDDRAAPRLKRSRLALACGALFGYAGPAALLFTEEDDDAAEAASPGDLVVGPAGIEPATKGL